MPFMMLKKTETCLQDISQTPYLRATVDVSMGTAWDLLPAFKTCPIPGKSHCLLRGFLLTEVTTALSQSLKNDKIEVQTDFFFDAPAQLSIHKLLATIPEAKTRKNLGNGIKHRVTFISALALSSVLPGATFKCFSHEHLLGKFIYQVSGADVRAFVEEAVTYNGDTEGNFIQAFYHLWMHVPFEITDSETAIKRLALYS